MTLLRDWAGRTLPLLACSVVLLAFAATAYERLVSTAADPERAREAVASDSRHYLELAEAFADGRRGDYASHRLAHRQPLYPALLAVARMLGACSVLGFGAVNLVIGLVTLLLLFAAGWRLFGNWWVGFAGGAFYALSEFVHVHVSDRILTEPAFVLAAAGTLVAVLLYLESSRPRYLLLAAGASGLAYLVRPNGLFLFGALMATLVTSDLLRAGTSGRGGTAVAGRMPRREWSILTRHCAALLVFVAVAAPSWAPRTAAFGNPLHHGYLSNYLWVDTYEEGHVSRAIYGPADYFSSHGPGDVVRRFVHGVRHVFLVAPSAYVMAPWWLGTAVYAVSLIGLLAAVWTRRRSHVLLTLLMLLQLCPFFWTGLSNPDSRVHYGALFPFLIVYVMVLANVASTFLAEKLEEGR